MLVWNNPDGHSILPRARNIVPWYQFLDWVLAISHHKFLGTAIKTSLAAMPTFDKQSNSLVPRCPPTGLHAQAFSMELPDEFSSWWSSSSPPTTSTTQEESETNNRRDSRNDEDDQQSKSIQVIKVIDDVLALLDEDCSMMLLQWMQGLCGTRLATTRFARGDTPCTGATSSCFSKSLCSLEWQLLC